MRKGAAKSERPDTPFEMLLDETRPDPAAEPTSRGDDRTPPQTTRCEPSTAADRSAGLTNSKPTEPHQARAIPAKDSKVDETDAAPAQDAIDPDADDVETDLDATSLADLGSPAATTAMDPAASPETPTNPLASPASPTTTPVAVIVPVNPDLTAIAAAPTTSDSETAALSPTLTPAASVTPPIVTAAGSQDTSAPPAPSADSAAPPDPMHPDAAAATTMTVQAPSPEATRAAAQIPDLITPGTFAGADPAAGSGGPAVATASASPQPAASAAAASMGPAAAAAPANPARAASSRSADLQDAAPPPSAPPTGSSAPNKPDDGAPRPAGGEPVASRLGRTGETANTSEAARPAVEQAGRAPEAPRPPGGATQADQAPGPNAPGTPTVSPGATKDADVESKPVAPHQHDVHDAAETLTLQPGASETRAAGTALLAAGHDATSADPARSVAVSAPTSSGGPSPGNVGTTAPTNAPYAMASSAPVPISGLAVELVSQMRDGKNRFEIRLDPPELGRIDVHLKVDRDGNVTSRLVVERSETLDLLRRDAPSLERALHNAGLKTGEQGLEFSLRNQGFDRDQGGRNEPGASRLIIPDEVQPSSPTTGGYGRRFGIGGGIDIRV